MTSASFPQPQRPYAVVCGNCHVYIRDEWKYCPWCGTGIDKGKKVQ